MTSPAVSVIIAAHDCAGTLDRAIGSALAQIETAEVIVVDDASSDDTVTRAEAWERREGRVRVIALSRNGGPAGARNRGFDAATGDTLAILDSDDFLIPGRLGYLLAEPDWEMAADNVVFVRGRSADTLDGDSFSGTGYGFFTVDTKRFVSGNRTDSRRARGEMGFLKPLMSRAFLLQHGLRYDETLRLGEDYDLFTRILLAGARFRVTTRPGYCAVVRGGSLSARHGTGELGRLVAAMSHHLTLARDDGTKAAMEALCMEVLRRHDHRRFLDVKSGSGPIAALRYARAEPGRFGPILRAVAVDKLRLRQSASDPFAGADHRMLLPMPEAS